LNKPKFLCDRMLGKLATWLRISGYDTVYVGDLKLNNRRKEDTFILNSFKDRILLTRDRELYNRCISSRRDAIFIKSDSVEGQIREMIELGFDFQIVMDRCSVCNSPLRKPSENETMRVLRRERIEEDLRERYELWYCEKCDKLYWMGGHWRNMVGFLDRIYS